MRRHNRPRPRVNRGQLKTWVEFYEYRPKKGPLPGEYEYKKLYACWCKVEKVWLRDLEQAKANGTLSDVTLLIRDPLKTYKPTNKHFFKIFVDEYEDYVYNVHEAFPDLQKRDFYTIIGKVKDDMRWT